MLGCNAGKDQGTPANPAMFNLDPTFFAAEPIEDIADTPPMNRLIIRLQRNGNVVEITDTLYFDIRDSAQIARCLRGAIVNGQPDWDTSSGMLDAAGLVAPAPPALPWCELSADPNILPSIHLVPFGPVAVSFAPLGSCHSEMHPPALVNLTGVANDGVITFQDFGGARQSEPPQATTPPAMRVPINSKFQVNYGDRLRATFHIDMGDERVAAAIRDKILPPPAPDIGGFLDGDFDFDFARGRSAQTFP